jgi:peptidoglycan/LPS O-acetylase OafA/YrhL
MLIQSPSAEKRVWSERIRRLEQDLSSIDYSISPSLSNALDILRSLAAFFVVINHIGETLFVFEDHLDPFNLFMFQLLYLGHHSVMILFVVSGFLIGRAAILSVSKGGVKIFDYAIDRTTRIYVVLLPALFIGLFTDWTLLQVSVGPEFDYVRERMGVLIFLGNIVGLQTIYVPTFGSNGPLWSLACELWYYLIFPIFLVALFGASLRNRLLALVGLIAALSVVSDDILHYGTIWCLGVLCWLPRWPVLPKWLAWSLLFLLLACANNDLIWLNGWGFTHIVATAFSVALIINSHRHDHSKKTGLRLKVSNFFAKFTYSLYLYHYPPLMVVTALLLRNSFTP